MLDIESANTTSFGGRLGAWLNYRFGPGLQVFAAVRLRGGGEVGAHGVAPAMAKLEPTPDRMEMKCSRRLTINTSARHHALRQGS